MLPVRPTLMLWSAMVVAVLAAAMPGAAHAQAAADIDAANKQIEQLHADRKYAEAMPLAEATLALAERVLGAEHRSTLSSVANLALLHSGQGNDDKAEPLYRRALEASERVLGSEDPDTLINLNNRRSGRRSLSWARAETRPRAGNRGRSGRTPDDRRPRSR